MAKKKTKAQKQKARQLRQKKRKLLKQQSFSKKSVKKNSITSVTKSATDTLIDKQLWNQKVKVKTGFLGRTKEVTFFNYYNWLDTNKDKTNMSYAVVECLVNMISELKYDDMERFNNITTKGESGIGEQCRKKKYTVEALQIIVSSMRSEVGKYGEDKNIFVDYFMQLKDRIKCKKLKFSLLTVIYQADSRYVDFEELKELRSNFTFEEMVWITCKNREHHKTEQFKRYVQRWIDDINKLYDKQGYLNVYRAFRVNRGEKIRQGLTRECKTMEGGKGNSFSFRKSISLRINAYLNTHMISKYLEFDGKRNAETIAKSVLQGSYMNKDLVSHFDNDDRLNDTFGVLGLFKIKKEDIVVYSDGLSEQEVIMDYKKAKLEDYTFTNIIHFFAVMFVRRLIGFTSVDEHKGDEFLDSVTMNSEYLFDTSYWYVSKYFKKNKKDLQLSIRNGGLNRHTFFRILSEMTSDLFDKNFKECTFIFLAHYEDNLNQFVSISDDEGKNFEMVAIPHLEDKDFNVAYTTGIRQTKKKAWVSTDWQTLNK